MYPIQRLMMCMCMCECILKAARKYAQASTLTDNQTLKKTKEDVKKTHRLNHNVYKCILSCRKIVKDIIIIKVRLCIKAKYCLTARVPERPRWAPLVLDTLPLLGQEHPTCVWNVNTGQTRR